MKKIFLLVALVSLICNIQAQKLMTKEVPSAVSGAFSTSHPTIDNADWKRCGNDYEVNYMENKAEKCVKYDINGKLIQNSIEIKNTDLPKPAWDYVMANYKEIEFKDAYRVTSAKGVETYEAHLNDAALHFDSKGTFVKSEKHSK